MKVQSKSGQEFNCHNGSISGFNSVTWYIPKIDVTLVFFTNGDLNSEGADVMEKAVKAYLKE